MVNLEWFRSFRAVYKTKSLTKASDLLMISQPTVSQHIAALESQMGQKLFVRKSKGVQETEEGKLLNTLVSGLLEQLELVEDQISKPDSAVKSILKLGVSPHLYKSVFCRNIPQMGTHVHVSFGNKTELKSLVENGKIYCAVTTEKTDTFDLICDPLYTQKLVLAASKDIDLREFEKAYQKGHQEAEKWLNAQIWYSHDANASFIKNYWLYALDKKRPSVIPNYIIPNEHEVLYQLSRNSGVAVCTQSTLALFERMGTLHATDIADISWRDLYLITNKKQYNKDKTQMVIDVIRREARCG